MSVPPPTGLTEIHFSASDALAAWEEAERDDIIEGWTPTGTWTGYPDTVDEEFFED